MADPENLVSDETAAAEERDAAQNADAGPMPTPEEEQAAKLNIPASESVKDTYCAAPPTGLLESDGLA